MGIWKNKLGTSNLFLVSKLYNIKGPLNDYDKIQ